MVKRLDKKDLENRRAFEGGFTLIELLVVVIILGILAAVVVFSVGGIGDKGQESACKVDSRTLGTAEAAYFSNVREEEGKGAYTDEDQLVSEDLLSEESSLHNVKGWEDKTRVTPAATPPFGAYDITVTEKGAENCLPDGVPADHCEDGVATPIASGTKVNVCTQENDEGDPDDDVRYPF